jgi:hypothetical protein
MLDSPIFVVGQARGGTTLLRDVLRAHPDIAGSFGESHFFSRFYNQYRDLTVDLNLDRLFDDFCDTMFFKEMHLDPSTVRCLLHNSKRSYESVLTTVMGELIKKESASRWVEKGPDHLMFVDTILDLFPNAQILHIVRDVRDSICSVLRRREEYDSTYSVEERFKIIVSISLSWQQRVKKGWFYRSRLSQETFMMLRYEDLILKTNEVLAQLSRFLNLRQPITRDMIDRAADQGKSSLAKPWSSFHEEGKGLLAAPIGRYRHYFIQNEIATIEFLVGRTMEACDYSVSGIPMPLASRISVIAKLIRYPGNGYRYVHGLLGHLLPP